MGLWGFVIWTGAFTVPVWGMQNVWLKDECLMGYSVSKAEQVGGGNWKSTRLVCVGNLKTQGKKDLQHLVHRAMEVPIGTSPVNPILNIYQLVQA